MSLFLESSDVAVSTDLEENASISNGDKLESKDESKEEQDADSRPHLSVDHSCIGLT